MREQRGRLQGCRPRLHHPCPFPGGRLHEVFIVEPARTCSRYSNAQSEIQVSLLALPFKLVHVVPPTWKLRQS